ncbi:MAG: type II toxin-antitoxin system prevent-host-death family antitoxin [Candidatus Kerfeldbacteria bacterium]|nr:type II toxin-antitoxin system prevent-host-death family antitoxin [Candidatus Kerfeldbacteria bacterium]
MNTSLKTLSITEARKRIFDIAKFVQKGSQYSTLTEHGRACAVVISADEFDSWIETIDIASNPRLVRTIRSARKVFAKKDFISLRAILEEEERVIPKDRIDVRSRRQKIRTQKSQKNR